MKTHIAALALTLALAPHSPARIGETLKQCAERYGKPFQTNKELQTLWFEKNGFRVMVKFHEGRAAQIIIAKGEQDFAGAWDEMSDTVRDTLLSANSGGGEWEKEKQLIEHNPTWHNRKGERTAYYYSQDHLLIIMTNQWISRQAAEKQQAEKQELEDF